MGTPEFAVPSLQILINSGHDVVAVVTSPDKPAGRGQKLHFSDVKQAASNAKIPVLQPEKLKNPAFLEELKSYKADLQVVVAFRMLPEVVWNMPPLGTINLHASLLPNYRGAAPINWAIINGETTTGVSTFFLQQEIDTGDLIFQDPEPIFPTDDAGTLYERLKLKGANLVLKTVKAIETKAVNAIPQVIAEAPVLAPKIFRETCEINFNQPAEKIINFIRGLSPYPLAWTNINGKIYKIVKAEIAENLPLQTDNLVSGGLVSDGKSFAGLIASDGKYVLLQTIVPEGKKAMSVAEWLRGNKF